MEKLTRDFYAQDTLKVSQELLGKHLVRVLPDGERLVCRITETEAYIGRCDKACHAYGGRRTPRTETLYARPGTAYVYLIYGMYSCINLVTEAEGEAAAVLIRGGVPVENGDRIARNRFGCSMEEMNVYQRKNFLNGPGKLCKGLNITRSENGLDLLGDELYVEQGPEVRCGKICTGKRIGIDYAQEAADYPWRFWLEN